MSKLGLTDKERLLDERASTWAGLRVVVVDVETTGLNVTSSRIVSLALAEILAGRVLGGYATLIDPGLSRIDAVGIHHITVETIRAAAAPSFASASDVLLDRLTPRDEETVILAGHNVVFDALMLHNELRRTRGIDLPAVPLMDTKVLAARAGVPAASLAELAQELGLVQADAHTAVSDAQTAASALLLLADKLRTAEPDLHVEDLTTVFDPSVRNDRTGRIRGRRGKPEPVLSEAHIAAHDRDLTNKRAREAALSVCVREDCLHLVSRVEDGITTPRSAVAVAEWVWDQLWREDISRATRGRLLAALSVSLGRTNDGEMIRAYFDEVTLALSEWGPCASGTGQCDRCADPDSRRTCRFITVRYALLNAYLHRDGLPDRERAEEFIPYRDPNVAYKAGRPRVGWFGRLVKDGDLDVAGYGAQAAASIGADSRISGRELFLLRQAWAAGSRNAKLADQLSKLLLVSPPGDGSRSHVDEALAVLDAALAQQNGQDGRVWDSLRERRARCQIKFYTRVRTPPDEVRNKRPARTSRYTPTKLENPNPPPAKKRTRKATTATTPRASSKTTQQKGRAAR